MINGVLKEMRTIYKVSGGEQLNLGLSLGKEVAGLILTGFR
jgi:hypothetical protein